MCKAWPAIKLFRVCLRDQAGQNARFAFLQANFMRNFTLADDGLLNTADWLEIRDRRHLDLHLQTNVAVWVNPRGDLDVDADIDVLELRVDKRIHETRAAGRTNTDSCLEAAGCHGHAVANIQLCRLAFQGTDFRVLNDAP